MCRCFGMLPHSVGARRLPDESTILCFLHLLEQQKLVEQSLATVKDLLQGKGLMFKAGLVVDATLIAARNFTKTATVERDPEMHQTKKGNPWQFEMKAKICVDTAFGLVQRKLRVLDVQVRPIPALAG